MRKINKDLTAIPKSLSDKRTSDRRKEVIESTKYPSEDKKYNDRYKTKDIKTALKGLYHGKCAFCEQKIEAAHIEHFRPKSIYYWLAYSWDNLLYICPTCNTKKSDSFEVSIRASYQAEDLEKIHGLASEYHAIEQNKMIHPELENVESQIYFTLNGKISSFNSRVQYTIDTCQLRRDFLNAERKNLIDELEKKIVSRLMEHHSEDAHAAAKIFGLIEDFISDAKREDLPYTLFRRYCVDYLLGEWLGKLGL